MSLENYLLGIANTIRNKEGSTEGICALDYASRIENMQVEAPLSYSLPVNVQTANGATIIATKDEQVVSAVANENGEGTIYLTSAGTWKIKGVLGSMQTDEVDCAAPELVVQATDLKLPPLNWNSSNIVLNGYNPVDFAYLNGSYLFSYPILSKKAKFVITNDFSTFTTIPSSAVTMDISGNGHLISFKNKYYRIGYPNIYSSSDGISWSSASFDYSPNFINVIEDKLVFIGNIGKYGDTIVAWSTDAENWSTVALPQYWSDGEYKDYSWYNIMYGGGVYVAIGRESSIYLYPFVSTDLQHWEKIDFQFHNGYKDSIFANGKFIVITKYNGTSGYWISQDGRNWAWGGSFPISSSDGSVSEISYGDGRFLVLCADCADTFESIDGETFTKTAKNPVSYVRWLKLEYVGNKFVALATNIWTNDSTYYTN